MRESFIFYGSFFKAISLLPDSERLKVYDAICKYSLDSQPIVFDDLSDMGKMALYLIEPQLKANQTRYENGVKGGAPQGNQNAKKTTESDKETTEKQPKTTEKQPNKTTKNNLEKQPKSTEKQPNKNVNVNDNVNENKNVYLTPAHEDILIEQILQACKEVSPNLYERHMSDPMGDYKLGQQLEELQRTTTIGEIRELIAAYEKSCYTQPRFAKNISLLWVLNNPQKVRDGIDGKGGSQEPPPKAAPKYRVDENGRKFDEYGCEIW